MASKGPLLTLLGGGVLAGGLLIASVTAAAEGPGDGGEQVAAGATQTEPPPATAEPSPSPEPTATPTEQAEPLTYVGEVDGGGASVAIVIEGEEAVAYVCDGVNEAWLSGVAADGELRLTGNDGSDAELVGSYDQDSAEGAATAGGVSWTFTIEQVDPPEGLYRIADTILGGAEVAGGLIVLPDGRQIGVATVDGEAGPAPRLDPRTGRVTVGDDPVTADRVG
ncbi:MAG TPA: hypothetical protein VIL37_04985 [Natronosporangium sp.]